MLTEEVKPQKPICQSDREKVFPDSNPLKYRVEATQPDGTVKVFTGVKAYTKSLQLRDSGAISIEIDSEMERCRAKIPYPYHYLYSESVLCALKMYDLKTMSGEGRVTFAINYNLFCLPWKLCIIAHNYYGQRSGFVASRAEWERGTLDVKNREVQMFLDIPSERSIALELLKLTVSKPIQEWIGIACDRMNRKGH